MSESLAGSASAGALFPDSEIVFFDSFATQNLGSFFGPQNRAIFRFSGRRQKETSCETLLRYSFETQKVSPFFSNSWPGCRVRVPQCEQVHNVNDASVAGCHATEAVVLNEVWARGQKGCGCRLVVAKGVLGRSRNIQALCVRLLIIDSIFR